MSENFEKLKAKLAEGGQLTDDEITTAGLTADEIIWLSAEQHSKHGDKQDSI